MYFGSCFGWATKIDLPSNFITHTNLVSWYANYPLHIRAGHPGGKRDSQKPPTLTTNRLERSKRSKREKPQNRSNRCWFFFSDQQHNTVAHLISPVLSRTRIACPFPGRVAVMYTFRGEGGEAFLRFCFSFIFMTPSFSVHGGGRFWEGRS